MLESSHLRDLLRVRESEDDGRDALAGLTLAAVLGCESDIRRPSRTLLDIIKDEESGAAYRGLVPPPVENLNNKNSWKSFKNRLRLRRAGAAFSPSTSSDPVNVCDYSIEESNLQISEPVLVDRPRVLSRISTSSARNLNFAPISPRNEIHGLESMGNDNNITPTANSGDTLVRREERQSPPREEIVFNSIETLGEHMQAREEVRLRSIVTPEEQMPERQMGSNSVIPPERDISSNLVENEVADGATTSEAVVAMPRVSLMALLEETDWTGGNTGSMDLGGVVGEEEPKRETNTKIEEEGAKEGGEYVCCVCMVRHKGAAFIPCGHTFCRLCSRELWVNRGNCPLCNGFILEILDIF